MESGSTGTAQLNRKKPKLTPAEENVLKELQAEALAWEQVDKHVGWQHLATTKHHADSCHEASPKQGPTPSASADPVAPHVQLLDDSCSSTPGDDTAPLIQEPLAQPVVAPQVQLLDDSDDDTAPLIQEPLSQPAVVPLAQPMVVPRPPDAASAVPEPGGLDLVVVSDDDCAQPHDSDSLTIIAEVFSPPRITVRATKHQLQCGKAFDLTCGTDLGTVEGRAQVWTYLKQSRPGLVVLSPPCTYFSTLMNLNKAKMGEKYDAGLAHARSLLEFSAQVCKFQHSHARYFLLEHPARAKSWQEKCLQDLSAMDKVYKSTFHQCRFALKAPGDGQPIKKPTTFLHNVPGIHTIFDRAWCSCGPGVRHVQIQGTHEGVKVSTHCQVYSPELCSKILQGYSMSLPCEHFTR